MVETGGMIEKVREKDDDENKGNCRNSHGIGSF